MADLRLVFMKCAAREQGEASARYFTSRPAGRSSADCVEKRRVSRLAQILNADRAHPDSAKVGAWTEQHGRLSAHGQVGREKQMTHTGPTAFIRCVDTPR